MSFDSWAMETLRDVAQKDEGRGHTLCKDLSHYRWLDTGNQESFGGQVASEGSHCLQNSKL